LRCAVSSAVVTVQDREGLILITAGGVDGGFVSLDRDGKGMEKTVVLGSRWRVAAARQAQSPMCRLVQRMTIEDMSDETRKRVGNGKRKREDDVPTDRSPKRDKLEGELFSELLAMCSAGEKDERKACRVETVKRENKDEEKLFLSLLRN
jgi:hypothetical protein